MANKERSFIYSIVLYIGLCLYSYYYQKYEVPLLPEPTNDPDWVIRGITYPLSFVFNFILALLFFMILKLTNLVFRILMRSIK